MSIVIPAYNEAPTIGTVVDAVLTALPAVHQIVIVDDGSTDATPHIAQQLIAQHPMVQLIRQPFNRGKTAALQAGFAVATGDIVVVQDADLEYSPSDISSLIEPIETGLADVVYGSRFMVKKAARVLYFRHYIANRFLTFLSDLFTDLNLSDVETGYKAFRSEIIRDLTFTARDFGFEIEVTARIAEMKCRVYEVPISYHGRTYEEGKKIGLRDGIAAVLYVLKYNLLGR